jgi:hypothetical protein
VLVPLLHGSLLSLSAAALAGAVVALVSWRAARIVPHGAKAARSDQNAAG